MFMTGVATALRSLLLVRLAVGRYLRRCEHLQIDVP
jgi:hypothetical protein